MKSFRSAIAALTAAAAVGVFLTAVGSGQQQPAAPNPLQLAPLGVRGEAIYPALEGWGPNKAGQNVILLGYFNRNREQVLDIPIGPNNRIEPGGPDYGQPTHFETGRQWGVFAIPTPKDFGTRKLTWTLVANGNSSVVTFWQNPAYALDFFKHPASGNTPPVIKLTVNGAEIVGPPPPPTETLSGTVGQPVTLKMWAHDDPETYDPMEGLSDASRQAVTTLRGNTRGGGGGGGGNADARGSTPPNFDLTAAAGRAGPAGRGGRGGGPPADITIWWKKYRGPGDVKVADSPIRLLNMGDHKLVMESTTTATFSAPGEYWLRAQVNDESGDGGGGDQCCWTSALVKVNIK
jgi:hypothetical protein